MSAKRPNCDELDAILKKLYDVSRDERLGLIPLLSANELEQLEQLFRPCWDGNVIGKSLRDSLFNKGLIDRWNGWNFVNRYGFAVLETLGKVEDLSKAKNDRR